MFISLIFLILVTLIFCRRLSKAGCALQPDGNGFLDVSMYSDIGSGAFYGCTDLKSLVIGKHTRIIGGNAF